jgi:hypothetical protein
MIAVALLAGLLGTAAAIERRVESFKRLAAYHYQAYSTLIDRAGGSLSCGTGLSESDIEEIFCGRGPEECRAYKAAIYHGELSGKYRTAAERPWLPVSADPTPPPGAFPQFEAEQVYYDLANDVDIESALK